MLSSQASTWLTSILMVVVEVGVPRSLRKEFLLESEEIAMKLDLLAGDGEKEKLERRRHETML